MATLAEQLENVQAAIEAIETGAQRITAEDGRTLTYADLGTLYEREKSLQRRINFQINKGKTVAEM